MPYAWPTLSRGAQREDFSQAPREDPTVRSMTLDGRVLVRKAPKPIVYVYSFELRHLSAEDKEALELFQLDVEVGGEVFTWDDERPIVGDGVTSRTVRLLSPMVFDLDDDAFAYRAEVELVEEVYPADSGA